MQPAFLSTLQVRLHDSNWSETLWELTGPLKYRTMVRGEPEKVTVPTGFVTDFASVPHVPLLWWLCKGTMQRAAVVHDWLYSEGSWDRQTCDKVFLEAGKVSGVSWGLRFGMYIAVRMFGGMVYNG